MKSNKGSGTKPELVLAKQLRRKLVVSALPGRPDFVYEKAKLAVFVHGCWWHGCPEHYTPPKTHGAFWRRKLQRNIERDKLNRRELEALGWKVVEVWEHEVRNNPSRAARRILKLVQRK